jgi:serine/threonine-protein kinase
MGEVYKARHAMLRRPTAVKLLPPEEGGESRLERFEREVQLTSRLTHPNTVSIFDYGRTPDGVLYYAMEYLDGISLEDLVAGDGPQPPARVVHVLRQVCGSLEEAHAIGLIHRDVKPANVILCERGGVPDVAKVFDFGLVKELQSGEAEALTRENVITGTPLYLAPESILSSDAVDARADIYAVGAVGYFLLTGRPVFDGRTLVEVCGHHLHTTPVPPSQRLGAPLPAGLEDVLLRCLEKDPGRRPRTARELGEALAAAGAGSWTAEDARAWWTVRGARLREPRPEQKGRDVSLLSVDWDRRAVSSED